MQLKTNLSELLYGRELTLISHLSSPCNMSIDKACMYLVVCSRLHHSPLSSTTIEGNFETNHQHIELHIFSFFSRSLFAFSQYTTDNFRSSSTVSSSINLASLPYTFQKPLQSVIINTFYVSHIVGSVVQLSVFSSLCHVVGFISQCRWFIVDYIMVPIK